MVASNTRFFILPRMPFRIFIPSSATFPFLPRCPLLLLIGRSSGLLQKLSVYGVKTEFGLSLISDNANNLQSLELPESEISNSIVEQIAEKLSNLTHLDLSYYLKIGAPAIEAIGKHCKQLTHLERNMPPSGVPLENSEDAEALTI